MTLEQLRIFIAVATCQHMTRAAESLGLTQSAASTAVGALERNYGVTLFHRIGRGIELSETGRLFLDEARAVVARAVAAERVLQEIAGLRRGVLTVQASQTIAGYWLPSHLAAFRRTYPDIEARLTIGNSTQVAKAVTTGAAEIGFVEGVVDEPTVHCEEIGHDNLVVAVAPDHPWAGRRVAGADLLHSPWVLREPGSGTRSTFEAALAAMGVSTRQLPIVLELPSNEAVLSAVMAGAGATAVSELVAQAALRSTLLSRVEISLSRRSFLLLYHRERYQSRAAQALLTMIRQKGCSGTLRAFQPERSLNSDGVSANKACRRTVTD